MYKISRKTAVVLCVIVASTAALATGVVIWKARATANEAPTVKATDVAPNWEFRSTKDEITDEIYTNMYLSGEAGSALLSIRCEKMIDVNGANVPIYTLQIATSDFLGKTELFATRSTTYGLHPVWLTPT